MKRRAFHFGSLLAALDFSPAGGRPAVRLRIDGQAPRTTVSPPLSGTSFEEINRAGKLASELP